MLNQLEVLKEKNILLGNQELVSKLAAMLDASNRVEAQVSTIQAISTSIIQSNDVDKSTKETNLGQACQEQGRSGRRKKRVLIGSFENTRRILRRKISGLAECVL